MKLAVYGTLKKGKSNHGLIEHCYYHGDYYLGPEFCLTVAGLPYVQRKPGQGVLVELYEVDDMTLKTLDRLEGHPNFYTREYVWAHDMDVGGDIKVMCYLYNHDDVKGEVKRVF
jgi:gamma-glutamylcyclotransferase (GGCT)/AIG2-like uncharacterized protein YtfP